MSETITKADVRGTWEAAAPGWAKWERTLSAELSDATDQLIDAAGVVPGMRVLDVACGAGIQSLRLAERVGPDGGVVASDISPTMLEFVRDNAARAGLRNIETLECAAEDLDALHGPFDASISRFGLMLFPSPPMAIAAIHRALKPGALFAALVFTTPANTPFLAQPMGILLRHAKKQPPPPGTPGLFALGADGVLQALFEDSGFTDVTSEKLNGRVKLPGAPAALKMMQEALGALRAIVADLDAPLKARAWADVEDCLGQFESGGAFEAGLELLIASGAKPH